MSVTFFTFASKIFQSTIETSPPGGAEIGEKKEKETSQKVIDIAKIFFLGLPAFLVGLAILGIEMLVRAVAQAHSTNNPNSIDSQGMNLNLPVPSSNRPKTPLGSLAASALGLKPSSKEKQEEEEDFVRV